MLSCIFHKMNGFELSAIILFLSIFILLGRASYLIYKANSSNNKYANQKRNSPVKTIICIGSGGHTTEMIKMIQKINPKLYTPRFYIMANNDDVSEQKIMILERETYKSESKFDIMKIPRSRIVNQSYITSLFTTLYSIYYCTPIIFKIKPDLILCNGPGTCIPICLITFLLKVFFICNTRIVFIESICRVESFSLSGLILMIFADNIVVQWEELKKVCKRADYLGQLLSEQLKVSCVCAVEKKLSCACLVARNLFSTKQTVKSTYTPLFTSIKRQHSK